VELDGGAGELLCTLVEELESSKSNSVNTSDAVVTEFAQVLLQDAGVNRLC